MIYYKLVSENFATTHLYVKGSLSKNDLESKTNQLQRDEINTY